MGNNMTKSELITSAADKAGTTKLIAEGVLNSIIGSIQGTLAEKKSVTLIGFGTFSVSERAARKGRNPQTGAEIDIKASTVPKFKPGKNLKDAVNN